MARYAEAHGCRMKHLVSHFGDVQDSGAACGLCDVCAPQSCATLRFGEPSAAETQALTLILGALHERDAQATGRLHRELFGEALAPPDFERLLGGLVRAGLASLSEDTFEKDGQRIAFQRVALTAEGRRTRTPAPGLVQLPLAAEERKKGTSTRGVRRTPRRKEAAAGKARKRAAAERSEPQVEYEEQAAPSRGREALTRALDRSRRSGATLGVGTAPPQLVEALKAWRLTEARRRRVPAFRILTDRVVGAIATARPRDGAALQRIHGVGPTLTARYGETLLTIVSRIPV